MIIVKKSETIDRQLIFRDTDDERFVFCIAFYAIISMTSLERTWYFTGGPYCGAVEEIFDILPDPYRTALLFDINLIEEVCKVENK